MAYRWNLDYVTDVHGNAMAYYYKQDDQRLRRERRDTSAVVPTSGTATWTTSTTGSPTATPTSGHVPDQVSFNTGDRCVAGDLRPDQQLNAANWPDVPYARTCAAGRRAAR